MAPRDRSQTQVFVEAALVDAAKTEAIGRDHAADADQPGCQFSRIEPLVEQGRERQMTH
jgi:hypothetical protein